MVLEPDGGHFLTKPDERLSPRPAASIGATARVAGIEPHHVMVCALREVLVPLRQQSRARLRDGRANPIRALPRLASACAPLLRMLAEELVGAGAGGRHQAIGLDEVVKRPAIVGGVKRVAARHRIFEHDTPDFGLCPGARFGHLHHGPALVGREAAEPECGRLRDRVVCDRHGVRAVAKSPQHFTRCIEDAAGICADRHDQAPVGSGEALDGESLGSGTPSAGQPHFMLVAQVLQRARRASLAQPEPQVR